MTTLYPWQQVLWTELTQAFEKKRLPQTLLIQAAQGLGVEDFVTSLAKKILCEQSTSPTCHSCQSCHFVHEQIHPDLLFLGWLEEKKISIEDIRQLIEQIQVKPIKQVKIVLIKASKLNLAASNALLKLLEEPPSYVFFILTTDHPERLLATIRSRCIKRIMKAPTAAEARHWLRTQGIEEESLSLFLTLSRGAPLPARALALSEKRAWLEEIALDLTELAKGTADIFTTADKWSQSSYRESLYLLYSWFTWWSHPLSGKSGIKPLDALTTSIQDLSPLKLLRLSDECLKVIREVSLTNAKVSYILEAWFIQWQRAFWVEVT